MGQIQSLEEFISLLSRRRWLIIAVALLGTLLSAIYAKSRPDVFLAEAVIQIETPTVTETAEPATRRSSNAPQLLQAIQQRLTTRGNLMAMIERHGLFADLPGLSIDRKVDLLRKSVTFESVGSLTGEAYGQTSGISALIIRAWLGEAEISARVANDFAQGILDQSSAGQMARADQNAVFFKEEEARLWQEITAIESDVAAYKNAHSGALPTLRDARRDELVSLNSDLRRLNQDLLALDEQRTRIGPPDNLRETDRRKLQELAAEISVLEAQVGSLTDRKSEIEAALTATPEVERVLNAYDRSLRQLQQQYEANNRRMAEAETSQRLAERQQAERITLLERAVAPEYPTGSGDKKLAIAGGLASIAAALALAFALDLLHPAVRSAAQMERQLGLRPVISIPPISMPKPGRGKGPVKLLDGQNKPVSGLPRFAVLAVGATVALVIAAAAIS